MAALDTLIPTLESIAVEDLVFPDKPIAIALQEANDLYAYVANPENKRILDGLVAVGMPKSEVTALKRSIDATRDAQSLWVVSRDRSKSDAQKEREAEGIELRSTIIAGARWNLRDDRVAQATVDAIQEGDGVEDLVQDLGDAAALIESRAEAFERDETFDVSALAEQARSLASAIRAGLSESRTANKPTDAKVLRDRAFTYLHSRVTTIREAGRYAFRNEPAVRARFGSAYERTKRRKPKTVSVEPETPTTDVVVEPVE